MVTLVRAGAEVTTCGNPSTEKGGGAAHEVRLFVAVGLREGARAQTRAVKGAPPAHADMSRPLSTRILGKTMRDAVRNK